MIFDVDKLTDEQIVHIMGFQVILETEAGRSSIDKPFYSYYLVVLMEIFGWDGLLGIVKRSKLIKNKQKVEDIISHEHRN